MNGVRSVVSFPGKKTNRATAAALASDLATDLTPERQRSATIASLSSQRAAGASTLKARRHIDSSDVDLNGGIHQPERNPFNVYPDTVPAALGLFLTSLAVGFLLAGIVTAGSVLIGVL